MSFTHVNIRDDNDLNWFESNSMFACLSKTYFTITGICRIDVYIHIAICRIDVYIHIYTSIYPENLRSFHL